MLAYKKLDWDSNFFGLSIAKIETESVNLSTLDELFKALTLEKIQLSYLFLTEGIPDTELAKLSGNLVDVGPKVLYHKKILTANPDYHLQIASYPIGVLRDELYDLALQSGGYSRFKLDRKLPSGAYEKLYRAWIEKSVARILAEEVLVFKIGDEIAGMVTLTVKNDWGDIGLIAVDSKYRGQKIGHHLLEAAYSYFYNLGIEDLGVETQANNKGACHFYEVNGFKAFKVECLYHIWL